MTCRASREKPRSQSTSTVAHPKANHPTNNARRRCQKRAAPVLIGIRRKRSISCGVLLWGASRNRPATSTSRRDKTAAR